MNDGQRKVLFAGLCLFIATGLYLPFSGTTTETKDQGGIEFVGGRIQYRPQPSVTTTREIGTDYHWAWEMPNSATSFDGSTKWSFRLDVTRLLIEWVFIAVLVGGIFTLLGNSNKKPQTA